MRFSEIIAEAGELDGMIEVEDEAETRGDVALATALRELSGSASGHIVPRIRMDALVELVNRLPGGELFNASVIDDVRKSNKQIKNLIADIKDDNHGVKYVYLTTRDEDAEGGTADSNAVKSQNTVDQMASRAAGK